MQLQILRSPRQKFSDTKVPHLAIIIEVITTMTITITITIMTITKVLDPVISQSCSPKEKVIKNVF